VVDGLVAQEQHVVPFFERHPLVIKASDFHAYSAIVRAMRRKKHLERPGFERLVRLAYAMNFAGKQRSRSIDEILMGSSETARQARTPDPSGEPVKIQSDPRGDTGSQAEMT
jgi:hypothetical protein